MLRWLKEASEKRRRLEELKTRLEDAHHNGAKTILDVQVGRLSIPRITNEQASEIEALSFSEFRCRVYEMIEKYKPLPHRHFTQSEEIVVLDDFTQIYWLSAIPKQVLKKFTEDDFSTDNPDQEFIKRCFSNAYERGFLAVTYEFSEEEHIAFLERYWRGSYLEIATDRLGELILGKDILPLAKALVRAQNDF